MSTDPLHSLEIKRPASDSHIANSDVLSLASYLKAAADPLRLSVLRLLKQDSFAVLELCHLLAVKQSGMSHHLKILAAIWFSSDAARRQHHFLSPQHSS
jgi:predicted transcriptional regulator